MKDAIRDPVKVDAKRRVISGKGEAHRWLLNVPASITGKDKERLFFRTETAAKARRDTLLEARKAAGDDMLVKLKERGMSVAQAINYALKHAPRAMPRLKTVRTTSSNTLGAGGPAPDIGRSAGSVTTPSLLCHRRGDPTYRPQVR
jgi:hypothetical protein